MFLKFIVAILLHIDDVIVLSKSRIGLHKFYTSYEFCTYYSMEVDFFKTKLMIFGRNKIKSNQEAFYLDQNQIEITHEYKYLDWFLFT